jgi:kynurenine formamidase
MPRYFDLTYPIHNDMPVYPGDPGPNIVRAPGVPAPWRVTDLRMGTHTGTHMDAPAHYFPGGKTIDTYPPERLVLPGVIWDVPGLPDEGKISWEALAGLTAMVPSGGAAIIRTGWGRWWGTQRYWRYPSLSVEAAQGLAAGPASLIGMDLPSADPMVHTPPFIHEILLSRDLLLAENLAGLDQLEPGRLYQFAFLPLSLAGLDGSPIRAIAWQPD